MNWRAFSVTAGALAVMIPSTAFACDMYGNSIFHRIPMSLTIGAGAQFWTGDNSATIASADLSIPLAGRAVIAPAVGLCTGDDDFSEMVYGGTAAIRLFSSADNKLAVNAQAGLSIVSYGDDSFDVTETTIPLSGAVSYAASANASIYGGAGLGLYKFKVEGFDESSSDPFLFGGVMLGLNKVSVLGGVQLWTGDDSALAINVAVRLPVGGG